MSTTSESILNWGIIATGSIAGSFAQGVRAGKTGRVVAVASRSAAAAGAFAQKHDVGRAYEGYDKLLADRDVQAVYIATPHPMHALWAIQAARAGKHVLVEKPIGMNGAQARAIVEAAAASGVFLMEAFMYRCHPQMAEVLELVRAGALGKVLMVHAEFSFFADGDGSGRLFAQELGGGGILDVGCYPVSFARAIAGAAVGKLFDDPVDVRAVGTLHKPTGVDAFTTACLRFESGILATCTTGVKMPGGSSARIVGTEGSLEMAQPWLPGRGGAPVQLILRREHGTRSETLVVPCEKDLYAYEADEVAASLAQRQSPAMSWEDSVGNMHTLDRWRQEIGLVYDCERVKT